MHASYYYRMKIYELKLYMNTFIYDNFVDGEEYGYIVVLLLLPL